MASNLEKINNILNYFKGLVKENQDLTITEDMVYDYLIKYGVPANELEYETSSFFNQWKEECAKLGNIKILDIDSPLTCDLTDSDEEISKSFNPIKIYLPLKYESIDENVKQLLAFFSKKKIPFEMKIADKIRTDGIIIRLANIDDVNKLTNFIKYNDKIKDNLLKPNPFCYQEDNISMTNDGSISYIQVVASYISKYINSNKDNIDEIKLHKFYNYIIDYYKDIFVNYTKFGTLEIPGKGLKFDENDIVAYQNSTELLLKASEEGFNQKDFIEHVEEYSNSKEIKARKKQYTVLNTLINYIGYQSQKMDIEEALNRLDLYLETGNEAYISNSGSTRTSMYLLNFRHDLQEFLDKNGKSLIDFYESLNIEPKKYDKLDEEELNEIENTVSNTINQIVNITKETIEFDKLVETIQLYLATNDYSIITRNNNLREIIVTSNLREKLLTLLNNNQISLTDYMSKFNNIEKEEITVKEETNNEVENEEITQTEPEEIEEQQEPEVIEAEAEIIPEAEEQSEIALIEELEPVGELSKLKDDIDTSNEDLNQETQIIDIDIIKTESKDYSKILKDAVNDTYDKYQQKYLNGDIKVDGLSIVTHALISGITKEDFSSFTRENDARKNLVELGSEKIFDTIMDELEIDGIELKDVDDDHIRTIVERYLDYVIEPVLEEEKDKVA